MPSKGCLQKSFVTSLVFPSVPLERPGLAEAARGMSDINEEVT